VAVAGGEADVDQEVGKGLAGRLLREFREQARPKLLVPATLISMSLTACGAFRAFASGQLLDLAVAGGAGAADFAPLAGLYFGAALYGYVANVVQGILFALARWNMSMAMREKLFGTLMRQEVAFFEANKGGALVSRLTNDTDQMQQVMNRAPETLVTNLLRCGISLVLMAKQNYLLTFISILPLPFSWVVVKQIGKVVGRYGVMQNDALASVNAVASEAISNARAVQIAGAERTETWLYSQAIGAYLDIIRRTLFSETALRFLSTLINDACTDVPLMCLSCLFISQGHLTVGQFYTYRSLLFSYRRGFRELAELFTGFSRAKAVSTRYFELTDRIPLVRSAPGATLLAPSELEGVLELDGVSFRYPGQDAVALQEARIIARPGELVALVGSSGAGKSTVLRLCARLADPTDGAVRLDGRDLREIELASLRRCLAVVDQEPAMFDRTVAENIAYGLEGTLDEAALRAAASAAQASEFIAALPGGFDERLGERGTRLSGGQRQRLALARAVAVDARVLLLDEPTSALDGESEEAVASMLKGLAAQGCTVLVAAHRLATVARADRVYVLDGGRVVEQGTRDELLAIPGSRYRTVVEPGLAP